MGKRGRKTYEEKIAKGERCLMPERIIAQKMNLSPRTIFEILASASKKLGNPYGAKEKKGKFFEELVLETIHGVATERDILQPLSIECQVARGDYVPPTG